MHPGSLPSHIPSGRVPPRADWRAQSAVGGGHREEEQHRVPAGVRLPGDLSPPTGDFFSHSLADFFRPGVEGEGEGRVEPAREAGRHLHAVRGAERQGPGARPSPRAPPCPTPRTRTLHARHAGGALPLLHCVEGREGWAQHRRDHLPRHRAVRALPAPLQIDADPKTMRSGRREMKRRPPGRVRASLRAAACGIATATPSAAARVPSPPLLPPPPAPPTFRARDADPPARLRLSPAPSCFVSCSVHANAVRREQQLNRRARVNDDITMTTVSRLCDTYARVIPVSGHRPSK